jgi:FYVE zinc finger
VVSFEFPQKSTIPFGQQAILSSIHITHQTTICFSKFYKVELSFSAMPHSQSSIVTVVESTSATATTEVGSEASTVVVVVPNAMEASSSSLVQSPPLPSQEQKQQQFTTPSPTLVVLPPQSQILPANTTQVVTTTLQGEANPPTTVDIVTTTTTTTTAMTTTPDTSKDAEIAAALAAAEVAELERGVMDNNSNNNNNNNTVNTDHPSHGINTNTNINTNEQPYTVATASAPWQYDDLHPICHHCHVEFHPILNRKHHCRNCGYIFCQQCSRYKALLPVTQIVLHPITGKQTKPQQALEYQQRVSFSPNPDPDRMLTYITTNTNNLNIQNSNENENYSTPTNPTNPAIFNTNEPQVLYGQGLEERFALAREPLRVCQRCYQQVQSLQEQLRNTNSHAMRYNNQTMIDPTHIQRFFNSPLSNTIIYYHNPNVVLGR